MPRKSQNARVPFNVTDPELKALDDLLFQIARGDQIHSSKLLPYLCLPSRAKRFVVNALLALAYSKDVTPERLQRAKVFMERACTLSKFAEELVPLCLKIYSACGDTEGMREVYKRQGLRYAEQGNTSEALRYFDLWQNAYASINRLDKFSYDYDVLDCIERLTKPHRFCVDSMDDSWRSRKIRITYLTKGITEVNSVLIRICLLFAQSHDKSRFAVSFAFPEAERTVLNSPQGADYVKLFQDLGCSIIYAPESQRVEEKLFGMAKYIHDTDCDLLITTAGLSDFSQYYIMALQPAPITIAQVYGPPPQFVSFRHGLAISGNKHLVMECPVDCHFVRNALDLPNRADVICYTKCDLDLPENSSLLVSAGRPQKFQDPAIWKAMDQLLNKYSHAYFLVIGAVENQIPFLNDVLSPAARARLRFFGWRDDYLRILGAADIVIDTYPSGGGFVLMDSAALEIPFVSFENNYWRIFDQTDWSLAEEILSQSELIVPRHDFEQFLRLIENLIEDPERRINLGRLCREQIIQSIGNSERMVRSYEEIYLNSLNGIQISRGFDSEVPMELALDYFNTEILRDSNFDQWEQAYASGYQASMGDHRRQVYNSDLERIGYYAEVEKANKVAEFAPGNGSFMLGFIHKMPEKQFYLIDISRKNIEALELKFAQYPNAVCILNDRRELPLSDVNSVFSLLLCQCMPRTLWIEHLAEVYRMLASGGSYVFQFAHHFSRSADDSVPESISGSNYYDSKEMSNLVQEAGFRHFTVSNPIDLRAAFHTDIVWFLGKAVKGLP